MWECTSTSPNNDTKISTKKDVLLADHNGEITGMQEDQALDITKQKTNNDNNYIITIMKVTITTTIKSIN